MNPLTQAEVLDVRFDRSGDHLASASADRTINLWSVYGEECRNYGVLKGPKGPIMSLDFSHLRPLDRLYAASADRTVTTFDLRSGLATRRHRGHNGIVNALSLSSRDLIGSASDDGTVRIWTEEERESVDMIELGYPVTALEWSADGQQLFIGGIDNDIHCFDLRKKEVSWSLRAHLDTISGLRLSPDGSFLLSSGFDDTLRIVSLVVFNTLQTFLLSLTYPLAHVCRLGGGCLVGCPAICACQQSQ